MIQIPAACVQRRARFAKAAQLERGFPVSQSGRSAAVVTSQAFSGSMPERKRTWLLQS